MHMFSLAERGHKVSVLELLIPDYKPGIPSVAEAHYDMAYSNIRAAELKRIGESKP